MNETLRQLLFPGDDAHTFAIVDGASCKDLQDQLDEHAPDHVCLYAGELEPDLQQCAPYLVALPPAHPFTDWFLDDGFGQHWGIFARSPASLRVLRKHYRTFLLVKDPKGETLYFRYYDPRVLGTYLPTCNPRELAVIFGPVHSYVFEQAKPPAVLRFTLDQGKISQERFALRAERPTK